MHSASTGSRRQASISSAGRHPRSTDGGGGAVAGQPGLYGRTVQPGVPGVQEEIDECQFEYDQNKDNSEFLKCLGAAGLAHTKALAKCVTDHPGDSALRRRVDRMRRSRHQSFLGSRGAGTMDDEIARYRRVAGRITDDLLGPVTRVLGEPEFLLRSRSRLGPALQGVRRLRRLPGVHLSEIPRSPIIGFLRSRSWRVHRPWTSRRGGRTSRPAGDHRRHRGHEQRACIRNHRRSTRHW